MFDGPLEIRPIAENDLGEVLAVYRQCEDFLALGPQPNASRAMIVKDIMASRCAKGLFCGIYTSDEKMIGVVDFVPCNFEEMDHVSFISLLMIIPAFRRQGVGTRILELVEDKMKMIGRVSEIRTAVQLNNPMALRFWQQHDYCVFGNPELRPDQTVVTYLRKDI